MKASVVRPALVVFAMLVVIAPVLAQTSPTPSAGVPSTSTPGQPRQGAGASTTPQQPEDASQPNPTTGVLQPPPPGPPPEGETRIRLPDCAPPNCGTPQIMTE